jgi:hypothetical protein
MDTAGSTITEAGHRNEVLLGTPWPSALGDGEDRRDMYIVDPYTPVYDAAARPRGTVLA